MALFNMSNLEDINGRELGFVEVLKVCFNDYLVMLVFRKFYSKAILSCLLLLVHLF